MNSSNIPEAKYDVSIRCESISLPPFEDILVLSHKCPQGKIGVSKCINLLSPDDFEMVLVDHPIVEAIIVSNKIINKMPINRIIDTLAKTVFPLVSQGEIMKVDFKVSISWTNLKPDYD